MPENQPAKYIWLLLTVDTWNYNFPQNIIMISYLIQYNSLKN